MLLLIADLRRMYVALGTDDKKIFNVKAGMLAFNGILLIILFGSIVRDLNAYAVYADINPWVVKISCCIVVLLLLLGLDRFCRLIVKDSEISDET